MDHTFNDIPDSDSWELIQPITEGWSTDQKYYLQTQQGSKLLLRISDGSSYQEEAQVYAAMQELGDLDIEVSRLLDAGLCQDGMKTYRLFSWIEGEEARQVLPSLSTAVQYQLGVQSGNILREIHSIAAPVDRPEWSSYFSQKIDRNLARYVDCPVKVEHAEKIIDYLNQHRNLLENRPQCFHHGDYHIGNMLITPQGSLGVIDFNRLDFGDPWEEFNRITWCAAVSKWFASGRIDGYFEGNIPASFFPLMALYIGSNQLGALPWAVAYGEEEIQELVQQLKDVLSWYDNFQVEQPSWYVAVEKNEK